MKFFQIEEYIHNKKKSKFDVFDMIVSGEIIPLVFVNNLGVSIFKPVVKFQHLYGNKDRFLYDSLAFIKSVTGLVCIEPSLFFKTLESGNEVLEGRLTLTKHIRRSRKSNHINLEEFDEPPLRKVFSKSHMSKDDYHLSTVHEEFIEFVTNRRFDLKLSGLVNYDDYIRKRQGFYSLLLYQHRDKIIEELRDRVYGANDLREYLVTSHPTITQSMNLGEYINAAYGNNSTKIISKEGRISKFDLYSRKDIAAYNKHIIRQSDLVITDKSDDLFRSELESESNDDEEVNSEEVFEDHSGLVNEVIEVFWKSYDPENPDSIPRKEEVKDWLISHRGVASDHQANAIDIVARGNRKRQPGRRKNK